MLQATEFTASDIGTFTSAIVSASRTFQNTRPWWRGQRDATWSLSPSLYRRGIESKEHNLNSRFLLMAKARRANCPNSSDALGWLFLMQHYGLPIRLLDWTQSPLVALFFALQKPDDADATVWALSPTRLNLSETANESICMPGSPLIDQLGVQAFRVDTKPLDQRILSVLTEEADVRHMVQQSAFTLHGRAQPLEQHAASDRFLLRIRIPSYAKEGFRQVLALYGINRATLFPDLDNLAAEITELDFENPTSKAQLETGSIEASAKIG